VGDLTHSNRLTALKNIAIVRLGMAFRSRLEHDAAGGVAILQMKDVSEISGLSYANAIRGAFPTGNQDVLLRHGDLVFRSRGRSNGAALVGADVPPAILAAPLLLIRPLQILPEFLFWYLNSDHAQAQLSSVAAGTSVQMISAESLRALPVPVPPVAAQKRIAEIADLTRRDEELTKQLIRRRAQLANHILMNYAHQGAKEPVR
jgi:type I restriction modification DNA specificity protein